MIEHLEDNAHGLSDEQLRAAELLATKLKEHYGKENAITNEELGSWLTGHYITLDPFSIRRVIHHIRVTKMLSNLVACQKGYYVSKDPVEIKRYMNSLASRAQSILAVRNSFELST